MIEEQNKKIEEQKTQKAKEIEEKNKSISIGNLPADTKIQTNNFNQLKQIYVH